MKITSGSYKLWVQPTLENGTVGTAVSGDITMTGQFNFFNFQAAAINQWAGSEVITQNTYGYNVYITLGAAVTRTLKFRHVCNPKYRQYNLHFLNRLGGYDTMAFRLVNKRKSEFQRSSYRRNPYQLSNGQMKNIDSYNKYNEVLLDYTLSSYGYNMENKMATIQLGLNTGAGLEFVVQPELSLNLSYDFEYCFRFIGGSVNDYSANKNSIISISAIHKF